MCTHTHVDDFKFGGSQRYIELVARRIKVTFTVGTENDNFRTEKIHLHWTEHSTT